MAKRLRRVEQVERNREVVLDAARRVFLERGYAGASLEAIAEEAGFSKGVVYSQFGSKPDLFLALLERRIEERAAQNERIAAEFTGSDGLEELLRVGARDSAADQGWPHLLIEFRALAIRDRDLNRRYAQAHERTVEHLVSMLTRLHGQAGIKPVMPIRSMAEFILAGNTGIALERAANPGAIPDEDVARIVPRAIGLR